MTKSFSPELDVWTSIHMTNVYFLIARKLACIFAIRVNRSIAKAKSSKLLAGCNGVIDRGYWSSRTFAPPLPRKKDANMPNNIDDIVIIVMAVLTKYRISLIMYVSVDNLHLYRTWHWVWRKTLPGIKIFY